MYLRRYLRATYMTSCMQFVLLFQRHISMLCKTLNEPVTSCWFKLGRHVKFWSVYADRPVD